MIRKTKKEDITAITETYRELLNYEQQIDRRRTGLFGM